VLQFDKILTHELTIKEEVGDYLVIYQNMKRGGQTIGRESERESENESCYHLDECEFR